MNNKKSFFAFLLLITCLYSQATTWEIEVGGGGDNGTPYFSPQNLSIMQGDIIDWVWVSGIHDVLSTSGPVSFASDTHFAPHTYSFEFGEPGIYDYICSYLEHSETQFGTITVSPLSVLSADPQELFDFVISPNPAVDFIKLSKTIAEPVQVRIFDISGRMVYNKSQSDLNVIIDCNDIAKGICVIEMSTKNQTVSKKLTLN